MALGGTIEARACRCWGPHRRAEEPRGVFTPLSGSRRCQGVGGILVVTMVTSFIVMYSSSISKDGSPPRSPLSSPRWNPPVSATSRAALMGYTSVMDRKPLRMHCKTCSLVTSSGQLTGHRRGGEIDQSDCVIRMNDAPIKGFQQDVGQRTDVRVVAHSSLQRVLQSRQQLLNGSQVLIFWGPGSGMRRDGRGQIYNTLRLMSQLLPKLRLFVISRIKMLKFDESFKEETGIDRSSSHLTVPYHYYEPWGPDECSMYLSHERSRHGSHHRFITEKMVFSNWARTLNIHFYQPDWEPAATMTGGNFSPPARSGNPRYRPSQRASGNLWTVSREQISSLATVNVLGSRRTEQAVSRTLRHLAE
ncbi:alpha-N-acetylgalactosaminide alpha-2,6-sialyltransferase 5 isoform X4 [Oryzias latipes]|uniref:alpha-N-acetylgalactosaminide alpha-2,6-sialyltransferase 5 isoform X4 n=1 Tax=Oryzias latipes TaxID=8090 RepID=UPI000CE245CF|nr:alpha-N-acetylgalactosaminide alpha-2,6-sialyltransferase 5 isoform X4 [Oryzias latipes]